MRYINLGISSLTKVSARNQNNLSTSRVCLIYGKKTSGKSNQYLYVYNMKNEYHLIPIIVFMENSKVDDQGDILSQYIISKTTLNVLFILHISHIVLLQTY